MSQVADSIGKRELRPRSIRGAAFGNLFVDAAQGFPAVGVGGKETVPAVAPISMRADELVQLDLFRGPDIFRPVPAKQNSARGTLGAKIVEEFELPDIHVDLQFN